MLVGVGLRLLFNRLSYFYHKYLGIEGVILPLLALLLLYFYLLSFIDPLWAVRAGYMGLVPNYVSENTAWFIIYSTVFFFIIRWVVTSYFMHKIWLYLGFMFVWFVYGFFRWYVISNGSFAISYIVGLLILVLGFAILLWQIYRYVHPKKIIGGASFRKPGYFESHGILIKTFFQVEWILEQEIRDQRPVFSRFLHEKLGSGMWPILLSTLFSQFFVFFGRVSLLLFIIFVLSLLFIAVYRSVNDNYYTKKSQFNNEWYWRLFFKVCDDNCSYAGVLKVKDWDSPDIVLKFDGNGVPVDSGGAVNVYGRKSLFNSRNFYDDNCLSQNRNFRRRKNLVTNYRNGINFVKSNAAVLGLGIALGGLAVVTYGTYVTTGNRTLVAENTIKFQDEVVRTYARNVEFTRDQNERLLKLRECQHKFKSDILLDAQQKFDDGKISSEQYIYLVEKCFNSLDQAASGNDSSEAIKKGKKGLSLK